MKHHLPIFALISIIIACYSYSENEPQIYNISFSPALSWNSQTGMIYKVQASSDLQGSWVDVESVFSKTNTLMTWVDSGFDSSTNFYYRVVIATNNPAFGFSESFELAEGWSELSTITWTSFVASGKWMAGGFDESACYIASNPSRARSGDQYAGFTFTSSFFGYLELPIVNSPTQLSWWARGSSFDNNGTVELYYHDGFAWQLYASHSVNGLVYSQKVVNLSFLGIPNPGQRLRFRITTTKAIYLDDIYLNTVQ